MPTTILRLLLVLLGLALAGLGQRRLDGLDALNEGLQYYGGALLCWLAAFARAEWLRDDVAPPLRPLSRRAQWIGLAVILLVAAFFRFYKLVDIPWGMSIDGSANALKVLDILRGAPYEPLYIGRETLYHYLVAGFFEVLGPSQFAFRAASALLGMAALLTLFLAARELFDARLALLATALMAVSTYHLTFSRNEWRAIQVPVYEMLALFLVLRAMRVSDGRLGPGRRAWPWWIAAGVSVGLGLNTYEAFRLVVIALGILILGWLARGAIKGRWPFLRQQAPRLLLFVLFAAIFFGPLGWTALTDWNAFNARSNTVFIGERVRQAHSLQPIWDNLRNTLLTYNYRAFGDFFDNQKPMLNPLEAVLFVGGVAAALGNIWRRRPALLLMWFAVTSLTGLFSWPNVQRLIATIPLVYIFGALFLYATWVLLDDLALPAALFGARAGSRRVLSDWLGLALAAAVLVAAARQTWDVYLGPQRRNNWGFEPERMVVAQYVKPLRDSDQVIIEERFNQGQVQFVNWRPGDEPFGRIFPFFSYGEDLPLRRPIDRPVTILLEDRPEHRALIPLYQSFYPNLRVEEVRDHYDPKRSVAFALRIALEDIQNSWGWRDASAPAGLSMTEGAQRWQAMLYAPRLAEYALSAPDQPAARLFVQGMPLTGPVLLTPGFHLIEVEGVEQPPQLFWDGQPVPAEFLFARSDAPASLAGAPAQYQRRAWRQALRFGGNGREPGRFFRPMAIEVSPADGAIFVADVDNVRVQRFDANGVFQQEFGRRGAAPGELEHEFGLALDGQGALYLADRWNDRLQAFTTDGQFLRVVAQMGAPRDVLVEQGTGALLATVPGSRQLWRLSPDGQVLQTIGLGGTEPGQFQEPIGLAQDAQGAIYVSDAGRKAVLKFSRDGQFLLEWPAPFVTWESYVAVSPDGLVYVSAPEENTVHAFTPDGVRQVQGTRGSGYYPFDRTLNHPMGLAFDAAGNLYVTSTFEDQVVKFAPYEPSAEEMAAPPPVPAAATAGAVQSPAARPPAAAAPLPQIGGLRIYTGTVDSRVIEAPLGRVQVSDGRLRLRVLPAPGHKTVYDYLRLLDEGGRELRFEAEDAQLTRGDVFTALPGADGHWWNQEYDAFSARHGLVSEVDEGAPALETTIALPNGNYALFVGTFTGDQASGPFVLAVEVVSGE